MMHDAVIRLVAVVFVLFTGCALAQANVSCTPAPAKPEPDGTLTGEGIFVLIAVTALVVTMALGWIGSLAALFLASTAFAVTGVISTAELFSGFVNKGMLVVALMFVVVNPISHLPVARNFVRWLLRPSGAADPSTANAPKPGVPASSAWPRAKLCLFAWLLSPFLGNVPHVAVMTPVVTRVCRELELPPGLMLLPMAMAVCTTNFLIIGSSSNLIVQAMLAESGVGEELGFFELIKTNGPVSVLLLLFYVLATPLLLRGGASKKDESSAMNTSSGASSFAHPSATGRLPFATIAEAAEAEGVLDPHDTIAMLGVPATAAEVIVGDGTSDSGADATPSTRLVPHRCLGKPLAEAFSHMPADVISQVRLLGVLRAADDPSVASSAQAARSEALGDAPLTDVIAASTSPAARAGTPSAFAAHQAGFVERLFDPDLVLRAHDVLVVAGRPGRIRNIRHLGPFAYVAVGIDAEATARPLQADMSTSRASVAVPPPAGDASPLLPPKLNWSLPAGLVALPPGRKQVPFVHVVVAEGAHGVGQRLATHSFAGHYNCGVISCRTREGHHIFGTALGMHELAAGDSLVIRARPDFLHAHCGRPSTEFHVADPIGFTLEALLESRYITLPACFAALLGVPTDGSAPPENAFLRDRVETRAGELYVRLPDWWPNLTLLIFVAVVAAAMAGVDLVQVCAVAIIAMVVLSLVTVKQAIGHVDWNVYVTGAMAFGIGSAMSNSGVAAWIGQLLLSAGLSGPWLILVLAVLTSLIANVVTDRGSVQVMFPIALAIVRSQGTSMLPYTVAIANAALGGVLTPFGLSTSLIVAGPGRYVARDFAVFGAPLLILYTILSVAITCLVYGLW